MSIFLFTAGSDTLPEGITRSAAAMERIDPMLIRTHRPQPGDLSYLDVSGFDEEARRKAIAVLRRRCGEEAWGIVDPRGAIEDPAAVFFLGASDYVGPAACLTGVDKARIRAVMAFAGARRLPATAGRGLAAANGPAACSGEIARPVFNGWKSIQPGTVYPFLFLYVSVSAQMNLKTRLGEAGYIAFRDRLRFIIQQALTESDPLLWMETDASALYLVPPCEHNVGSATETCFRMLLGAPLIGYERLCLPFPITFTFAMHYGTTEYAPPGKTGTIVSDAVNFSYHLGAKRAEPGRLTISGEAAALFSTRGFQDLFVTAGSYEGRDIVHSRRFGV